MSLHAASCPFCAIARNNPPYSPLEPRPSPAQKPEGHAYILLATPVVQAFLDLAPISRGHVLLATRAHKEKLADVSIKEGRALGAWMKVVSKAVLGGLEGGVTDWNIVQNNGARAAQVVPHVHFHFIPRPGDVPEIENRSWTVFGKGQREDLDDDDAVLLIEKMRDRLKVEIEAIRTSEGDEAVKILLGDGDQEFNARKSRL